MRMLAARTTRYEEKEVMEKDKVLDDKNVAISRKGAELAVAGLNLVNTNARLNTANNEESGPT